MFFNISCSSKLLNEGDRILLIDRFGHYLSVSADTHFQISPEQNISDKSIFKVKSVSNEGIKLTDYGNSPVYIQRGELKYHKDSQPSLFKLKEKNGRIHLLTKNEEYLSFKENSYQVTDTAGIKIQRLNRKNLFEGNLPNKAVLLISISFLFYLVLIFNFFTEKKLVSPKLKYLLILISHSLIAYLAISAFDFLHLWDECFHALVGKNLTTSPTVPMLYKEECIFYSNLWSDTTIWLHKQPLFLYQIAASLKLFGLSVFSVRLPSAILMSICGVMIYRMGKLLFNDLSGIIGSFLFCFSLYKMQLLMGMKSTDHNDLAFLFYITASIWAFLEYQNKQSKKYFVAIFIFSAFAVLNKWLLGFLVYYLWGLIILFKNKKLFSIWQAARPMLMNFAFSVLLVLPWQVYIWTQFPEKARFEFDQINKHLFEVVEDHSGNWDFHFLLSDQHYGLNFLLITLCTGLSYFAIKEKNKHLALIIVIFSVYGFFTFAQTKMESFTFILSPFIFIMIAASLVLLYKWALDFKPDRIILVNSAFVFLILMTVLNTISFGSLESIYSPKSNNYIHLAMEVEQEKLKRLSIDDHGHSILFNCKYVNRIPAMFYNDDLIAYMDIPIYQFMEKNNCGNRKILIFDNGEIPENIANHPNTVLIPNY